MPKPWNAPLPNRFKLLLPVLVLLSLWTAPALLAQITNGNSEPPPGHVTFTLRVAGGRTQFHLGEVIPLEVTITSDFVGTYPVPSCSISRYTMHSDTAGVADRQLELAALGMVEMPFCSGGMSQFNLREKPFHEEITLNDNFHVVSPGQYRFSAKSNYFHADSNPVDVEILPRDPVWEAAELARAETLLAYPQETDERLQACPIIRFLETDDSTRALVRAWLRGECHDASNALRPVYEGAVVGATNRDVVVSELEAGLSDPDLLITVADLKALAFASVYRERPDWYPQALPSLITPQAPTGLPGPQVMRAARAAEIRYAQQLVPSLPRKSATARAVTLKELVYLGDSLLNGAFSLDDQPIEIPQEIPDTVRALLPGVFRLLPEMDQYQLLRARWPDIKSPAMLPVLEGVLDNLATPRPDVAVTRLYDLAPDYGRALILHQLRQPQAGSRFGMIALGILPDAELPEFDQISLQHLQNGDSRIGQRISALATIERYASKAIAPAVLEVMTRDDSRPDAGGGCQERADLLAYLLRVGPLTGTQLLTASMDGPREARGCHGELLRRLADTRMSAEVETSAIAALDDPDTATMQSAVYVLMHYASANAKQPLLERFRQWHAVWADRADELELPAQSQQRAIERAYLDLFSDQVFGWIDSPEDMATAATLCVSTECKQAAEQTEGRIKRQPPRTMISFGPPTFDNEYADRIGMAGAPAGGFPAGTMERLQTKMLEYPKGTIFYLNSTPPKLRNTLQRVDDELRPWVLSHGYRLEWENLNLGN